MATVRWRTLGRPTVRSVWTHWLSTAAPMSASRSWPRRTCHAATPTATTAAAALGAPHSYDLDFNHVTNEPNLGESDHLFWEPLPAHLT